MTRTDSTQKDKREKKRKKINRNETAQYTLPAKRRVNTNSRSERELNHKINKRRIRRKQRNSRLGTGASGWASEREKEGESKPHKNTKLIYNSKLNRVFDLAHIYSTWYNFVFYTPNPIQWPRPFMCTCRCINNTIDKIRRFDSAVDRRRCRRSLQACHHIAYRLDAYRGTEINTCGRHWIRRLHRLLRCRALHSRPEPLRMPAENVTCDFRVAENCDESIWFFSSPQHLDAAKPSATIS